MKSIFASKTFWVNALTLVADGIGHYGGFIPPDYQPYIVFALAVVNAGLRLITTQPVKVG